jgi:sporulation protein YlmC with PRC-barrel domain
VINDLSLSVAKGGLILGEVKDIDIAIKKKKKKKLTNMILGPNIG